MLNCLPKNLHPPQAKYQRLNCSTCLSTFGIVGLFNLSHCQGEKVETSALRMLINRSTLVYKHFTPFQKPFGKSHEK